jgi:hypothetical protein
MRLAASKTHRAGLTRRATITSTRDVRPNIPPIILFILFAFEDRQSRSLGVRLRPRAEFCGGGGVIAGLITTDP